MEKEKFLILSAGPQNRLKKEFNDRGYEADVYSPNDFYCYLSNANGHDRLYLKSDESEEKDRRIKLKDYSAIIPRISGGSFRYGKLIVKHISENLKVFTTASEFGLSLCSNKFETCQYLSKHKIRSPKQMLAHKLTDYKQPIELVGGFPFIMKLQRGSEGSGVFMIRDEIEASQTLRALRFSRMDVVLSQKLNSGEVANDIRCWVIGALTDDVKIFAYKRYAVDGEFRSNYSISHSGIEVELTNEETEMAVKAARVLKMNVAGIDIMRDEPDDNKPYIIEVNGNPGLAGIEAVTGENVAGAVVDMVIENYNKGNTWDERNYFNQVEIMSLRFMAQKAFENIKAANSYDKRELYIKNYAAQDYIKRLLKNSENLISNEQQ